jgi:SAM-dependent methyltransferase
VGRRPLLRRLAKLPMPGIVRRALASWSDRSREELLASIAGQLPGKRDSIRILDVGCFDGRFLDRLSASGSWETYGLEPNEAAAAVARQKGHRVWSIGVEEARSVLPQDLRFDIVFLGQTIERVNDPIGVVQNLKSLMAADGVLVLRTPNLDSAQVDLFGPTWSHWHPPYHRFIFSRRSMGLLAKMTQLRLVRCRTWSHPDWSRLSIRLNRLGLAASVPHGTREFDEDASAAESLAALSRLLYDWRGKGDYLYAVMKKDLRG